LAAGFKQTADRVVRRSNVTHSNQYSHALLDIPYMPYSLVDDVINIPGWASPVGAGMENDAATQPPPEQKKN
jgi:hypothetical protein